MIKYMLWVGGGLLGGLLGIAFGAKLGYMGGVWAGDAIYHAMSSRQIAYVKAS